MARDRSYYGPGECPYPMVPKAVDDIYQALLSMTQDEVVAIAIKAGIYTKSGKLRKAYR